MRASPLLLAALTALVALAGCLDDEPHEPQLGPGDDDFNPFDDSTATSTSSTTTQQEEPDDEDVNQAPNATITASIEQGAIPFDVQFTLDGSDADGDALQWTFDADGDGTADASGDSLPSAYNHTYSEEGLFLANLTVNDGSASTWQVLEINATAAAAGPAGKKVLLFSGTIVAPDPTSHTHTNCLQGFLLGEDGPGSHWFDLPSETWGGTYAIDADGIEVRFADSASAEVFETGTEGTVPEGPDVVEACGMEAVNTSYTITIEY